MGDLNQDILDIISRPSQNKFVVRKNNSHDYRPKYDQVGYATKGLATSQSISALKKQQQEKEQKEIIDFQQRLLAVKSKEAQEQEKVFSEQKEKVYQQRNKYDFHGDQAHKEKIRVVKKNMQGVIIDRLTLENSMVDDKAPLSSIYKKDFDVLTTYTQRQRNHQGNFQQNQNQAPKQNFDQATISEYRLNKLVQSMTNLNPSQQNGEDPQQRKKASQAKNLALLQQIPENPTQNQDYNKNSNTNNNPNLTQASGNQDFDYLDEAQKLKLRNILFDAENDPNFRLQLKKILLEQDIALSEISQSQRPQQNNQVLSMPSLVLDNDINLYIEKHPMFFEDKAAQCLSLKSPYQKPVDPLALQRWKSSYKKDFSDQMSVSQIDTYGLKLKPPHFDVLNSVGGSYTKKSVMNSDFVDNGPSFIPQKRRQYVENNDPTYSLTNHKENFYNWGKIVMEKVKGGQEITTMNSLPFIGSSSYKNEFDSYPKHIKYVAPRPKDQGPFPQTGQFILKEDEEYQNLIRKQQEENKKIFKKFIQQQQQIEQTPSYKGQFVSLNKKDFPESQEKQKENTLKHLEYINQINKLTEYAAKNPEFYQNLCKRIHKGASKDDSSIITKQ